jgi:outer membrane protein assembly factor BamB
MNRAITFTPAARKSADPQDFHYFEQGSRYRSIHALLQDCAAQRTPARASFLQKAYREVVSRFVGFGKIEHPLPFLRELTRVLDRLSKRLDCRVDDFHGLGVYILIQDGATFYLLASRDAQVSLDWGDGFQRLSVPGPAPVRELPLEVSSAQKELFAVSTRDHLALYRIDGNAPAAGSRRDTALCVVMGGVEIDHRSALETISGPRWDAGLEHGANRAQEMIAHDVVYVSFSSAVPVRDPVLDAMRQRRAPRGGRAARFAAAAAAALVLVAAGALWFSGRSSRVALDAPDSGAETASASQDASIRLKTQSEEPRERVARLTPREETLAASATGAPEDAGAVNMAVEWRTTYGDAVTTTPALDGGRVIFGSRDGRLYSLDAGSGEVGWSYAADEGVGASPVVVEDGVVGADYRGNVFRLDKTTGRLVWKRSLGGKVVSTPCVAGGEVLVGCTDGVGYGLSLETGRVLWKVRTGGRIRASAVAGGGRFFLPSYDGNLYAISQGTGAKLWSFGVGGQLSSSPAADAARVVIGGGGGVYAVDAATGKRQWRFRTPAPVQSFILMEGGHVYAGCDNGRVYCLNAATGAEVWSSSTGQSVLSRPRLEGELLFVTSYDKSIYCLNARTGERLDRLETAGPIYSSPVIAGDRVFFGNNQGEFYCINYRSRRSR